MIKALGLHNENSGCDYHRVCLPFQYGTEYVDESGFLSGDLDETLESAQVITWNRLFPFGIDAAVNLRAKTGAKLVVDLDDHWNLYPGHYLYAHYQEKKITEQLKHAIRTADGVTVTTARLANEVMQLNQNVHVIPNALPFGHGQFTTGQKRNENDVYRFVYPCQRSHMYDARVLKGPLQRFAADNNRSAGVTLAGFNPDDRSGIWSDINRTMSAGGKMANYSTINQLPLDQYMSLYDHADAVLIPLVDNYFNHHKSNLKILEAATRKLPVICQKVPPYSDCDAPVLWVERQSDWYKHMKYLEKNREAGYELGERLHHWAVSNHNLFAWNRYRFDLYGQFVNS